MATNKVEAFGNVLIDLTNDTVSSDTLALGVTAHDKSGNVITGTMNGGGGVTIETITVKPSSASTTFTISGLKGQPKFFALAYSANLTSATTRYAVSANWNGTQAHVTYAYKSGSNAYVYQSTSYLTVSYSNGTLTLRTSSSTNGGNWYNGNYRLVYGY